jgi:hypothetical protein
MEVEPPIAGPLTEKVEVPAALPPVAPPVAAGRNKLPNPLSAAGRGVGEAGEMVWLFATVAKDAVLRPPGLLG